MSEETTPLPPPTDNTDPRWSNWLIDQLEDDELVDGYPKTVGLIRLARKYIGPFGMMPDIIQTPQADNFNRATSRVIISFSNGFQFGGSADVCTRNCDPPFSNHPVASAETRALGRALRLALGIKKATAEEISEKANEVDESEYDGKYITSTQIQALNTMCKRYNINVKSYVQSHVKKASKIEETPLLAAQKMMKDIQQYQQGTEVPDELKGYDSSWREKFGENK